MPPCSVTTVANATRYRVYDPLRAEWAIPFPAVHPMTLDQAAALVHPSEPAALMHGRQLIGPSRPWLVLQPVNSDDEGRA